MSLLEQANIKKRRVDKGVRLMEFDAGENESRKYEVEAIQDSVVYAKKLKLDYLPSLYYLVFNKRFS